MSSSRSGPFGRTALARTLWLLGAVALALALAPAIGAAQDGDVAAARIDGQTRFHTAANIATQTYDEAPVAVVATGEDYADALAASYPAGMAGGPVLLTRRGEVPDVTFTALDDLGVEMVVLVGGGRAISAAAEQDLQDAGYEAVRHAGADRFETAAALASYFGARGPVGTLEGDRTAVLASGEDFPDALSAGPLAADANLPLLLTPTRRPHDAVTAALEELGVARLLVVGGDAAVGSAVTQHYADLGYAVERFAGRDRTETAVAVARLAVERLGFSPQGILLARGDDFPDAMSASVHGAAISGPLLLSASPQVLSSAVESYLADECPATEFVRAIGGSAAVSDDVLHEATEASAQCHDDRGGQRLGRWSALDDANAPTDRLNHSAVWDGTELVVWGGGEPPTNSGHAYDPAADVWRPLPQAPIESRRLHEAVWAGDRMIVYGGSSGPDHLDACFTDGAAFHQDQHHPANDHWTPLAPNPYHRAGCGTSAVWTGAEMLVWGGNAGGPGAGEPVNVGAAYSPATDTWRPLPASPLGPRSGHQAVWTGQHMIVVGGTDADHGARSEAAAYDPATDQWTRLPDAPIAPRANPVAVWTGGELVVTGGSVDGNPVDAAAAYNPATGQWRRIADLPGAHIDPVAAWSGNLVLLVGGDRDGTQPAAVGWDPATDAWTELARLPGEHRVDHTVDWVGDRLVVVGGRRAGGYAWQE